jgi:D-threo-aldose 1-dehydrogenase
MSGCHRRPPRKEKLMRTRPATAQTAVTEIGFGASQLGNLSRAVTDEDARATVDEAWDQGVRYFDTAPHYGLGLSERRLGDALSGRRRDDFVLSTKVGRLLKPDPTGADREDDDGFVVPATYRRSWDFSRDGILRSIDESLTRLGLDRIDIAYLHDPDDHWTEASTSGVDALVELREQGVLRAIGAGMNQSAMLAEFVRRCDVDVVMVAGRYSLLDQSAADDLLPLALERGVAVVAAAVYNSGLLSSARPSTAARFDYRQATPDVVDRARELAEVCERHGVSLPEAALAFPLRHDAVRSVVVGMRSPEQASSTIDRYDAQPPADLWRELEELGLVASERG